MLLRNLTYQLTQSLELSSLYVLHLPIPAILLFHRTVDQLQCLCKCKKMAIPELRGIHVGQGSVVILPDCTQTLCKVKFCSFTHLHGYDCISDIEQQEPKSEVWPGPTFEWLRFHISSLEKERLTWNSCKTPFVKFIYLLGI